MCVEPNKLPDGSVVVCRKCEQCVRNKINDWVGRNIAESKVSSKTFAITLTYGRNEANEQIHERTVSLTYSDFQKYMKRLRRHGYNVRYFVTGEYGSLNGRAHWHAILHFYGKIPDYEQRQNFMQKDWDHGWSFWDGSMGYGAARYVCKYILKETHDDVGQTFGPMMSKKPPIGIKYFQQLAEQYVEQGLAPQDLEYSFPDVRFRKKDGQEEIVKFWLRGRSAELYLDHFIKKWKEAYPEREMPKSELVELYIKYEKIVKDEELLLRRRDFPNGERFVGRPWASSRQIRAAVEKAEALQQARQREKAEEDEQLWFETWIKEAVNGSEKEKREQQFKQWQHDVDAQAFNGFAEALCKKYKITRQEFDAQQEQYEFERQNSRNSKPQCGGEAEGVTDFEF